MNHRIVTSLAVLSLALCVATLGLLMLEPIWRTIGMPGWFLPGLFAVGAVPFVGPEGDAGTRHRFTLLAAISLTLCIFAGFHLKHGDPVLLWERYDHFSWPRLDFDSGPPDRSTTHIRSVSLVFLSFVETYGCFKHTRTIETPAWLAVGICAITPLYWLVRSLCEQFRRQTT